MLEDSLRSALLKSTTHPEFRSLLEYAVLPPGKLFRPKLVEAIALDIDQNFSRPHAHLATAIELHHAYTLVHDDLPSMDNDIMRRGKPTVHAQFGEWKAILGGDALLVESFRVLHQIEHQYASRVFKFFTWATGAKGLLLGQYLDLSAKGNLTLRETLRIHELKTARLIQAATVGSYL